MARCRWYIVVCLLWCSLADAAELGSAHRTLADFYLTSWTSEQGAPGDTWAVAQTTDGWLWFGGPRGLYRFDGFEFERVELTGCDSRFSDHVYTLWAEDSGDLWIGLSPGGVCRLSRGRFQHFGPEHGLPGGSVSAFARDLEGTLWVATVIGVARFDGKGWRKFATGSANVSTLHVDRQGTLWMGGGDRVYYLIKGATQMRQSDVATNTSGGFLQAPDGRSWYEDAAGAHLLPDQMSGARRSPHANAREPLAGLIDHDGYFWAIGAGYLQRYRAAADSASVLIGPPSPTNSLSVKEKLSGSPHSMIEDHEGSIWIATSGGVTRMRPNALRAIQPGIDSALYISIAPAAGGAVWVGTGHPDLAAYPNQGLWRYGDALERVEAGRIGGVTAIATDGRGQPWIGTVRGVRRLDLTGTFVKLPALPQADPTAPGTGLELNYDGALWAIVPRSKDGAYQYENGAWLPLRNVEALSERKLRAMARDRQGRLWLGYRDGTLASVHDDDVRIYPPVVGDNLGGLGVMSTSGRIVAGGYKNIVIVDGDKRQVLTARGDPTALAGVTGIVETQNGDLWLNSFAGAVHITNAAIVAALRSKDHLVSVEIFDRHDGFPGNSRGMIHRPTLIQGTDGRLWFTGTEGIAWLDPERIRRNPVPPPVVVKSVQAGEQTYVQPRTLNLPQGLRDLQINFASLSFARPEKVAARYRLKGYDEHWIDAGQRHQAFYTNLKPGEYRFSVVAANDQGVWNDVGASVTIVIPPLFTETGAFYISCSVAMLTLLWMAVTLWIRQVTRRQRSRLEERLRERERIARELHDTLLQGVQGLILHFQAVADRVDGQPGMRAAMEDVLDRADALLIEGRDRVKDLRRSTDDPLTLRQALSNAASKLADGETPRILVIETGRSRSVHPIVREETALLAIEAMMNALRHAQATVIEVEVAYEKRQLCVSVKDDGRGMDENTLSKGREGHFGLLGMRERAQKIRGRLTVWSRLGAGTEVRLIVPAAMAYRRE